MQKISIYIFSLLLLTTVVKSQDKVEPDSAKRAFIPTGIRIGWDALSTYRSFAVNSFSGWEINGDVDFRNYYFAFETGQSQREVILSNGDYSNSGGYWRVGIDINLFKKDPKKNMFFLGFRIGHSKYDESLTYTYTDSTYLGTFNKTLVNNGMTSGWAELTTGLKIQILRNFWMGYTARMKFFASIDKNETLQSYDIPGYGLTYKKPWWGFNYYLMYRIPIRKEKK